MSKLAALYSNSFEAWVHASVGDDQLLRARHRSLIASHLLGGLLSAVVFAGYFAVTGAPGAATALACLCFLSQIAIAVFLSRTGELELAHLLSAANLTALVSLAAALSGGSASFAIAWLVLVPLEAALSSDRRMMVMASVLALAALLGLHLATVAGALPAPVALPVAEGRLTLIAQLGAVAYACALAASVQQIHRGAARALEASRELYRLIAENANDLITRHDATGAVTFASHASRSLLGLEPDRLMARGFAPFLEARDRDRHARCLARCLAEGVPVSEEFRLARPRPDGTGTQEIWVEVRCQPVGRGEGAAAAGTVIAVTRDITVRKAEAIELARARDEAEHASRAKTAFLATMSHELRTPLSSIIGFSELLHRELLIKAREPKHADYCRVIHQSGEHLLSLVKDLLDVSKIESGKLSVVPEPFVLDEVVAAAVEALRPMADGRELSLMAEIEPELPDVIADRRAVRQIVTNLVSNACKFTPSGGRIVVSARRADGGIELAVSDSGIGIAPEHVARIGRPFYQVDTRYARQNEGAGLGLSIVRGLAELHGSSLRIASEVGKGSRFSVLLEADAAGSAAPEPAAEPPRRQATVVDLAELHRRQVQRAAADTAKPADPKTRAG